MGTASAIVGVRPNYRAAPTGPSRPQGGTTVEAVRKAFPEHARKLVAGLIGLSDGAAKKKLEGDRAFDADELAVLLRNERGFALLTAIMGDAKPKWWVLCSAFMEVREAQHLQAKARAKIRRAVRSALDADTDLSSAIARAETFSDQEFMRPHADALRSIGGVPDSAVVASASKGRNR